MYELIYFLLYFSHSGKGGKAFADKADKARGGGVRRC